MNRYSYDSRCTKVDANHQCALAVCRSHRSVDVHERLRAVFRNNVVCSIEKTVDDLCWILTEERVNGEVHRGNVTSVLVLRIWSIRYICSVANENGRDSIDMLVWGHGTMSI